MYSMAYFLFVDDSYRLKSISDQKKSLRIQCLTLTTSFFSLITQENAPISRESVRGRQQYSCYLVFKENTCHHNLYGTCHKVCLCTHEISAYMQVGTTESSKQSSSYFPDPSQSLVANVFYSDEAVCGHSAQRDL